jgi:hypothetical protein
MLISGLPAQRKDAEFTRFVGIVLTIPGPAPASAPAPSVPESMPPSTPASDPPVAPPPPASLQRMVGFEQTPDVGSHVPTP